MSGDSMLRKGIYLREEGQYVGPFHTREDAELFLIAMEASGESLEGIEILEISDSGETFRLFMNQARKLQIAS